MAPRVWLFTIEFGEDEGGVGVTAQRYAHHLRALGAELTVLTIPTGPLRVAPREGVAVSPPEGIRVIDLPGLARDLLGASWSGMLTEEDRSRLVGLAVERELASAPPPDVLLHIYVSYNPQVVELIATRTGAAVIAAPRGSDMNRELWSDSRGPATLAALRRAVVVLAPNQGMAAALGRLELPGVVEAIANSLPPEGIPVTRARRGPVVLTGPVAVKKGGMLAFELLGPILGRFPEVEVRLVNPRQEASVLEPILGEAFGPARARVQVASRLPRERFLELLSSSSLWVSATLGEGFANTALEALATGCPIVAPRVPGIEDLEPLFPGRCHLFPPGDRRAGAAMIESALAAGPGGTGGDFRGRLQGLADAERSSLATALSRAARSRADGGSWPADGSAALRRVRRWKRLEVCFFSHSGGLAGAERSLLGLVRELVAEHAIGATVVLPHPGPLAGRLEAEGVRVLVPQGPLSWWCLMPSQSAHPDDLGPTLGRSLATVRDELLPLLRTSPPDLVWTQTLVHPWGAVAAHGLGRPHVWSICENPVGEYAPRFRLPWDRIREEILAVSARVFVPLEGMVATVAGGGSGHQVETLPRRIPDPMPGSDRSPSGCFRIPGALRLGVFGTLAEAKGQLDAVAAAASLVRRGRSVELVVAGAEIPEYRARLDAAIEHEGISSRVRMVGKLEDPYPAMRECDVVLACSRYEAFGRTVCEAMLLERPVVFSRAGGYVEYIRDGDTGLGYDPGDISGLVARIERLADDPVLARSMGQRGRITALLRFDRSRHGGRVRAAFDRIAGMAGPARIPAGIEG